MSHHSALLAYLAQNPLYPILERFRTNYRREGLHSNVTRAALFELFHDLRPYGGEHFGKNEEPPFIPFIYVTAQILHVRTDLSIFQHLIHAIENDYEEDFILQTCINLVGILSCDLLPPTPFQRIPPSPTISSNSVPNGIPEHYSHLAANPTKAIENELGQRSFIKVYGFWNTFFENKAWSDQTMRIWYSYIDYKSCSDPGCLTLNMKDQGIWAWLASFNNLFLSQLSESNLLLSNNHPILLEEEDDLPLRGQICISTTVGLWGKNNVQGQLDFHITAIGQPCQFGDWSKVRVVGGLSTKPAKGRRKIKFIEMATYVREIFYAQPLRRFVHGFCLFNNEIEFWLIDRMGAYSSGFITLGDDEQVLVRAISSYLLMSDEELGLDTTICQVGGRSMIKIVDDISGEAKEIEIDPKPLVRARKLTSRGTSCYRSLDDKYLVKYCWHEYCGESEIDLLKQALSVKGVINLVASDIIHNDYNYWMKLKSLEPKRWHMKGNMLVSDYGSEIQFPDDAEEGESYEFVFNNYEFIRLVLSPYGRNLQSCTSVLQFLIVIRDAIMGHQRLHMEKQIIHGDISEANIIIVPPTENDRSRGVLIDLDNSIAFYDEDKMLKMSRVAGTIKFMALDQLRTFKSSRSCVENYFQYNISRSCVENNFHSTYIYDLESFFYVFITGCVEYGRDPDLPWYNLNSWNTKEMDDNIRNKENDICVNFKDFIRNKFSSSFVHAKELAMELQELLFEEANYSLRKKKDCNVMYNKMINAFNKTIGQIEAGKLPNRTWTNETTVGA